MRCGPGSSRASEAVPTRTWRRALCLCVAAVLAAAGCSLVDGAAPSRPAAGPAPAPPVVVSLTFNDGLVSQYEYAAPLLAAHRMRATFYVVGGWIGQRLPCCMAWWQVDALYRAGHEVGGMGLKHEELTRSGPGAWPSERARLRRQVCRDRQLLADRGYDPRSFAYPGGAFVASFPDASTPQDLVRGCGYGSARAVGGLDAAGGPAAVPLPPPDPYALLTPDVRGRGPVQLADLTRPVTAAARRGGGWVPIALDRVCHRGSRVYATCMASSRPISDTTLGAFLDWLAAAGRPGRAPAGTVVRTVRAALGAPPQPPLPPRPTTVSLTFDDGSRSQYAMRPILLDHGMRATFYINSGFVDRDDGSAMTWAQLRGLAEDGNDVGGHTISHRDLLRLSPGERQREVCGDRARLVANGLPAVSFAYPYGQFDVDVERLVRSCGYRSAVRGRPPSGRPVRHAGARRRDRGPHRIVLPAVRGPHGGRPRRRMDPDHRPPGLPAVPARLRDLHAQPPTDRARGPRRLPRLAARGRPAGHHRADRTGCAGRRVSGRAREAMWTRRNCCTCSCP
jgi:peptidoglycan/xylan/chitin deacetylase (PgdA/CDA1 family)